MLKPPRTLSSEPRQPPATSCPYCLAHQTQREEYLDLENTMSRRARPRQRKQKPHAESDRTGASISSSPASTSGSQGIMPGRWMNALSLLFAGISKRSQEKSSGERHEFAAALLASGVFEEGANERIEQHLTRLPLSYCTAAYTPEQVQEHMELLQSAAKLKDGYVAMRLEVGPDDDPCVVDVSASDSSCTSSAGGFSSLSSDGVPQVCKVDVTFASGTHVCRPDLACGLRQAGFSLLGLTMFDVSPRGSLGQVSLRVYREDFSQEMLESVFSSVLTQRSPSSRWKALTSRALGDASREGSFLDRKCDSECGSTRGGGGSRRGPSPLGAHRRVQTASAGDMEDVLQVLGGSGRDRKTSKDLSKFILDPLKMELGPVIAVGASGEVRKGVYDGMEVAVKVLKSSLRGKDSEAIVAEFRREVLTLMACGECPFLLKFYGIFVDVRSRMCIVTKYMKGGTLHNYLQKRNGRHLPMSEALAIATDVAAGMDFLHRNGITHRDLKSANVLLDGEGHAVVGDFGVAKLKGERGEMTKEVGTYRWMAPEAFGTSAWPVTHKSDVYSFGIVLWELVSLSLPFESYSPVQAAVAVTLNGLRPNIPANCNPDMKVLIERCWAKNPEDRPEFSQVLLSLNKIANDNLINQS